MGRIACISPDECELSCPMSTSILRFGFVLLAAAVLAGHSDAADLTSAVVVAPKELSAREQKAVAMLVEEVEKRTGVRWPTSASKPADERPAITINAAANDPSGKRESFTVSTSPSVVQITGADERGTLFGIGYLLRNLHMTPGRVFVDD
jgi:hypothetical protein